MEKYRFIFLQLFVGSTFSLAFTTGVLADEIGYDTLVARLSGQAIPNGAGINVAQVEAGEELRQTMGQIKPLPNFLARHSCPRVESLQSVRMRTLLRNLTIPILEASPAV